MTEWSPVATTAGLPYFPTQQGAQQLPAAVRFTSTAAETVDSLQVPIDVSGGDLTAIAEVYEAGTEIPDAVQTQVYNPSGDDTIGGDDSEDDSWLTQGLSPNNLYQSINDADDSTFILYFGPQAGGKRYRFHVQSGAWPADRRVIGGFVRVRANRLDATGRLQVAYWDGSQAHVLATVTVTENIRNFDIPWPENNPATRLPWTQADIQDLGNAGNSAIQLRPVNVNKRKSLRVREAYLSLDYVTETRVAVGIADLVGGGGSGTVWTFSLKNPNSGADNWAKADDTDYTVLVRRAAGLGLGNWRFLAQTATVTDALSRPDANVGLPVQSYSPVLDGNGAVSVMGDQIAGRGMAFSMTQASTATGVDGQPYERLTSIPFYTNGATVLGVGQEFVTADTSDYLVARFVLSATQVINDGGASTFAPAPNLFALYPVVVTVKNRSTDATIGDPYTLTPEEIGGFPAVTLGAVDWDMTTGIPDSVPATVGYIAEVVMTGVSLTAATDYYIELTTDQWYQSDTDGSVFWSVLNLDSTVIGAASYESTTYSLIATDGSTVTASEGSDDLPFTLSVQPDAPTNMNGDNVTAATEEADLDGTGCTIPDTEVAYLTWDPTILGDDFGCYQIQRGERAGFYALFGSMTPGDIVGQPAALGQTTRSNHIPNIGTDVLDGQSADISGALLTGPGSGAWYTWWETDTVDMRAFNTAFVVQPGSTFNAFAGFIVSNVEEETDPVDVAITSVHVTCSVAGYSLSFYDGIQEPAALSHVFDAPLADDGATIYEFRMSIDGNTVTIIDPEGHAEQVTDPRAARLWGETVLLEHFQPTASFATDALFEFVASEALDADDETYTLIYTGDDELAEAVTDWEAGYGQLWGYRMRAVRSGDWVPSAWEGTPLVRIEPQGSETTFGSNWLQAAASVNREPSYSWPQPNNDQVLQLSGRDYQILFQEAENRGDGGDDGFDFEIVAYVGGGNSPNLPATPGRSVFNGLRDFLRSYAPQLAIKDWTGDVWYGRATITDASTVYGDDGSAVATGEVTVLQTQAEPAAAPIPSPGS